MKPQGSLFTPMQLFAASQLVKHVNEAPLYAQYVGRDAGGMDGTIFGNPFRVGRTTKSSVMALLASAPRDFYQRAHRPETLPEVLAFHHFWLTRRMNVDESFRRDVKALKNRVLSCWCRGLPNTWFCHAQTLAIVSNGL